MADQTDLGALLAIEPPPLTRGTGPNALPFGAAKSLNETFQGARAANDTAVSPNPAQSVPGGQEMPFGPPPAEVIEPFRPVSDEEKDLFRESERPDEPWWVGLTTSGQVLPPPDLEDHLPALISAARTSGPGQEAARQLLALTMYHRRQGLGGA